MYVPLRLYTRKIIFALLNQTALARFITVGLLMDISFCLVRYPWHQFSHGIFISLLRGYFICKDLDILNDKRLISKEYNPYIAVVIDITWQFFKCKIISSKSPKSVIYIYINLTWYFMFNIQCTCCTTAVSGIRTGNRVVAATSHSAERPGCAAILEVLVS